MSEYFVNMYRNVTKSFPEISVYYKNALTASKKQKKDFFFQNCGSITIVECGLLMKTHRLNETT